MMQGDDSESCHEFYSEHLHRLGKYIANSSHLQDCRGDAQRVKDARAEVKDFLKTLENRAFVCCEWQKAIAFIHSESSIYLRGHR